MSHIFVVGGAGGLGQSVVSKLLERGEVVDVSVLNDREQASVETHNPGVRAIHRLDLGDADSVKADLGALLGEAELDSIIVCAAIAPAAPIEFTSIEVARRTFEINTLSILAIYQAALPALRRSKGRAIFVSSGAGVAAPPFVGVYAASKFVLEGLGDAMRRESEGMGVTISLVEPGGIRTPLLLNLVDEMKQRIEALGDEERALYGDLYRNYLASLEGSTPSEPDVIADVVLRALDDAEPQPRYPAGADAVAQAELVKQGTEMVDALFRRVFYPA